MDKMTAPRGAFLDVEPSLLTERLSVMGAPAEEPLDALTMPAEAATSQRRAGALEIRPQPAVCCKTRDSHGGKVFVNVCTSTDIPPPKELDEHELRQLLMDEERAAEFRVPMSLGEAHKELDKAGGPCVAYDVVIHPRFHAQVEASLLFKTFFVTVMIEAIEGKFGVELDKNQWTTMRNKLYLGKMPRHWVRRGDLPMVQECAGTEPAPPASRPLISELETRRTAPAPRAPPYQLEQRADGRLLVLFELPAAVMAPAQLSLEVGEDRLVLAADSACLLADVFLPGPLEPESARAAFCPASGRLAVLVSRAV
ncbi:PIH1 domain-containing protein 1-like isoform X2 [Pollicipes pollicipes]|nr:PIH1 domain-containing protein 1-like isoform X2 [Pollicipes pollicipes]